MVNQNSKYGNYDHNSNENESNNDNDKNTPEKRGRKPGTSWNGETRVERMGGISAGVGGGGGSARLY